ncbi:MAG TPA: alkaline phosphatase family protein [Verrucomicrobiae bacterium]|nr:alkaline phosphatase family protein [Verrucomicrobiae bacterium]
MKKLAVLFISSLSFGVFAYAGPPKLVVAILVDQMRYDYLERFNEQFTSNGFRLFMDHGAFLTFAHYNYVPTVTGPGHASFLSGSTPMMHGIIANEWFDRRTGKAVGCVEDPNVEGVGALKGKGRASPRNFIGGTFADELRLRFNSKVIGVSMKDRAAILPAGKKPAGAFWFQARTGEFITSSYYMNQLPAWVVDFNQRKRAADFSEQTWKRLLDAGSYPETDNEPWEGNFKGEKLPVFDHAAQKSNDGFDGLGTTPFANQLLAEFAESAIRGENLGGTGHPDLLCVSFSAVDAIGHRFGPYSQEVHDAVLRLDRQLSDFFSYIDQQIGLSNVVMVLTADHGVAPVPEFAAANGLDGRRLDESAFLVDLEKRLKDEFGPGRFVLSPRLYTGNLYLDHKVLKENEASLSEVVARIRDFALESGKFQACYSRDQILDGRATGPIGKLVTNGYNPERGGDVILVEKPFSIPEPGKTGTTHGSPYSYDTHVAVLFYGAPFKAGRYADDFSITDIVPTLCAALHMNEPAGCMGKPFVKILDLN